MSVDQMPSRPAADYPHGVRHISMWNDDQRSVAWSPTAGTTSGSLCWVDIDPVATPEQALGALEALCPEVTAGMVDALLEAGSVGDGSPVRTIAFANGGRVTCSFSVQAIETPEGVQPPAGGGGWLAFQPVSILVCGPLIATCWHGLRWYSGQQLGAPPTELVELERRAALDLPTCLGAVERRWSEERIGVTAADLGVLLVFEQSLTFGPAYREVSNWLERWELELYDGAPADESVLKEIWGAMAVLRDWIGRLNRPGIDEDVDKAWFRGASDHQQVRLTDTKIDRALSGLGDLGRTLRAAFAMQHARLEERERERREERQRRVEYFAALFLMPTLVVGFFGANVALPGGQTWNGFLEMVCAMVFLTGLTIWLISRRHRREDD